MKRFWCPQRAYQKNYTITKDEKENQQNEFPKDRNPQILSRARILLMNPKQIGKASPTQVREREEGTTRAS